MSNFTYEVNQCLTIVYENSPKLVRLVDVVSVGDDYIMVKDNGKIKKFLKHRILSVAVRENFENIYESIPDTEAICAIDEVERRIKTNNGCQPIFWSYTSSFIGKIIPNQRNVKAKRTIQTGEINPVSKRRLFF